MTEVHKSTGHVVNDFAQAAQRPEKASQYYLEAAQLVCETKMSGYRVRFNEDGPLNIMAAFIPLDQVHQAWELDGQLVACEWVMQGYLPVVTKFELVKS